ncbi:MAG: hypothetical protein ACLQDV_08815 [Candidatus Binataceae bacterium]
MGITLYGDESGTHDETGMEQGSEVATVAGFLARSEHWEVFTEKWVEVLDEFSVPAFHMNEFVDERGEEKPNWPYKGWTRDKCEEFIMSLVRVARDYTLVGFCGSVIVRDYEEVVPEYLKKETQHPYHFALQNLFDNVITTFTDTLPLMLLPREQVDFSFEQQDEFQQKALEIFERVKKRDHTNRLGSIAFVPKGLFRAHEAADLIAYRMRKVITRQVSGKPAFSAGSWDEELNARRSLVVAYVQRDGLLAMTRELEEQVKRDK